MFTDSALKLISLLITEDCINCRACDTICLANAIYPGGKSYELNNKKYKAPVKDHYYVVPEKCNFCEGVYEEPECVNICPMDAIKLINKTYNNGGYYEKLHKNIFDYSYTADDNKRKFICTL